MGNYENGATHQVTLRTKVNPLCVGLAKKFPEFLGPPLLGLLVFAPLGATRIRTNVRTNFTILYNSPIDNGNGVCYSHLVS